MGSLLPAVLGTGSRDPASDDSDLAGEVRAVLVESVARRRAILEGVLVEMQSDLAPTELVRRLLVEVPRKFAEALKPVIDLASRRCPSLAGASLTVEQHERLAIYEALLTMAGHPSLIFGTREDEQASAPTELNEQRWITRRAIEWASAMCPDVDVELSDLQARRSQLLLGKLADRAFWEDFFADPESVNVLDSQMTAIFLSTARHLFEIILTDRWDWFFSELLARPDLRQTIVFEHPSMIFTGLAACPQAVDLVDENLVRQLQLALARMTASERAGIRSAYASELESIGLDI